MLESIKVDELLVDVLTVIPSAAFAKKKIYLLVDCPEDFGCEFLVSGNSVFVLDADNPEGPRRSSWRML